MKNSVLLTVHDRESAVLMSTLRSLYRAGISDDEEVVIVDDRSTMDLSWAKSIAKMSFLNLLWIRLDDYDGYDIEGFRTPSRAFNEALKASTGENVWIMSSDVMVTPGAITRARQIRTEEMIWTPRVIDIESGMEYCGSSRLFPMPWFLVASRKKCVEIGGWDETYLNGLCYEDNDFVGRLALATGRFAGEWSKVVYHQSHNQPAYDQGHPEVLAANRRNREWTQTKWGGIPFDGELTPFSTVREMHTSGIPTHRCVDKTGKLESAIGLTTGIMSRVAV